MAQLLFVLLIIFIALGVYRCDGDQQAPATTTDGEPAAPLTQLEQTASIPKRVETEARQQVEAINERNRQMLDKY